MSSGLASLPWLAYLIPSLTPVRRCCREHSRRRRSRLKYGDVPAVSSEFMRQTRQHEARQRDADIQRRQQAAEAAERSAGELASPSTVRAVDGETRLVLADGT